jgi:hypothetical protein
MSAGSIRPVSTRPPTKSRKKPVFVLALCAALITLYFRLDCTLNHSTFCVIRLTAGLGVFLRLQLAEIVMRFLVQHRWWRPWARVAGVLLAFALFSSSPVQAECGDYIHMPAPAPSTDSQSLTNELGKYGQIPTDSPRPCSGPGCSRAPAVPPLPLTPPAPVRELEWGSLTALVCLPSSNLDFSLPASDLASPVHQASSIYHPPRSSCSAVCS